MYVYPLSASGWTGAEALTITNVLMEQVSGAGVRPGAYFSGATPGASWNGPAGVSTSSMDANNRANLATNPNFETSTAGWTAEAGAVLTRETAATPPAVPGLLASLDPSTLGLASGAAVTSAPSGGSSALGWTATGAGGVYQSGGANGAGYMKQVATGGGLSWAGNLSAGANTVVYAARQRPGGTGGRILAGLNNNWLAGWWGGKEDNFFAGTSWVVNGNVSGVSAVRIYAATNDTPGAGANYSLYRDGTLVGGNTAGTAGPNGLSTNGYQGVSEFSDSDLYAVYVYDHVLSAAERSTIDSYLSDRYNTTVSDYSTQPITGTGSGRMTGGGDAYSWTGAVAAGDTVTFSMDYGTTGTVGGTPQMYMVAPYGSPAVTLALPLTQTTTGRFSLTTTATTAGNVLVAVFGPTAGAIHFDNVLVERTSSSNRYFDGNAAGANWDGAANASTSRVVTRPGVAPAPASVALGVGATSYTFTGLTGGAGYTFTATANGANGAGRANDAGWASARDLVVALARVGVTATTSRASGARYGRLDTDSNLPDIRILVADRPHSLVDELVRRVGDLPAAGTVLVPATRPLTQVWVPNADVRDLDDLPSLVVRDVASVVEELRSTRVRATVVGDRDVEPHDDGTVALLTYGLPGFAVDPEGGLNLSLMRSCTGWPSGVWIDPPRRTAPDGSSFQLQHWTHEFRYALVSTAGDWREATLPARGQEFSTPLLPVNGDGEHPAGDLPPTHSLLTVEPSREVLVATLKAAGNPVAQGSSTMSDPTDGVTLRLVESTGRGSTARVTWSTTPATAASRADLLEVPDEQLSVTDATLEVDLEGSTIETVVVNLAPPARRGSSEVVLGIDHEAAQPTFARYWLHNRGPAPMGYLPVTVSLTPSVARCTPGHRVEVALVVANQYADCDVDVGVSLDLPQGWTASTPTFAATLAPHGHARFRSWVEVPTGAAPGHYSVAAQVTPGTAGLAGGAAVTLVEDVVTVFVGDSVALTRALDFALPTAADLERDVQGGTIAQDAARPTGVDLHLSSTSLQLHPGAPTVLTLTLTNTTLSTVRGELQVASPWGTWDWVDEGSRSVTIAPDSRAQVEVVVCPPADTLAGHSWLLPKLMWFGRAQYAETVRLEVSP